MIPSRPDAVVISLAAFARELRERGRIASLAGHKRVAFDFYRRAERYDRLGGRRERDERPWQRWPLPEDPSST